MWTSIKYFFLYITNSRKPPMTTQKFYAGDIQCPMNDTGTKCHLFIEAVHQWNSDRYGMDYRFSYMTVGCPTDNDALACLTCDRLGGACGASAVKLLNSELKNTVVTLDKNKKVQEIDKLVQARINLIALNNRTKVLP